MVEGLHRITVHTKDQTIQAEWLAIPSIVVDPMPAVLPAEVTKTGGSIYVPIYKKGDKWTARTIELLHLYHMPARK